MTDLGILLNTPGVLKDEQKAVIERPIPGHLIREREAGGKKILSYINGKTVVDLLNETFNYRWTFRVISKEVVRSEPKFNKYKNETEVQSPYIEVLGQLIIPELGIIKEQYGTKILLGGATEQEGASKAAATDAMKKCATLLGIGLELYDETPELPAPPPPPPRVVWDDAEVTKLREYKAVLGITSNDQLNFFVVEYLKDPNATFNNIVPENIKDFNIFLRKKAETV